jgi:hypothetical protein
MRRNRGVGWLLIEAHARSVTPNALLLDGMQGEAALVVAAPTATAHHALKVHARFGSEKRRHLPM